MLDPHQYITVDLQPVVPNNTLEHYRADLYKAMLIRRTEQRLLMLFSEGKLFGTVHTCIGQEFIGVAIARALQSQDSLFSNHRGHGHFLARTGNLTGLIGEIMGKSVGVCGGRGGSQHMQLDRYYSNGIQGGIVPVAAGLAFAHKLKRDGGVAVVFLGDGTLGQGVVYEALNIASKQELPILFVCENNLFAQSTSQAQTLAGDICARAAAFGIDTATSNTWNWPGLFEDVQRSIDQIREKSRPIFHRVDTFRLMAHSKGDDNRPDSYVEHHRQRDPINVLMGHFCDDPQWRQMIGEIDQAIERAVAQAETAAFGPLELPTEWTRPRQYQWESRSFPEEKIVQSIRRGLAEGLTRHAEVLLLGEDIESPYGGAFKCTLGLSADFPGRVRNMPISEAAMAGLGNGLALAGLKPVVEIMFGDFLTLVADQWINHAGKFRFMFNNRVTVPLIVRTPMGGKRGYAATHSQSLEKHFLGVPDTQVLCVHHRYSPAELYRSLLATIDRPTLVIENKTLYGQTCSSRAPAGFELLFSRDEDFPTARLRPGGTPDVTLLAIGGLSIETEQAALRLFQEEEVAAELFLPSRLYPFDVDVLAESLKITRRLVVIEEGQGFVSLGSEILAQVAERYGPWQVACRRVSAAPVAIPAARPLEQQCLPGIDAIIAKVKEVMRESRH